MVTIYRRGKGLYIKRAKREPSQRNENDMHDGAQTAANEPELPKQRTDNADVISTFKGMTHLPNVEAHAGTPFYISGELRCLAKEKFLPIASETERARTIYDCIIGEIDYSKSLPFRKYRRAVSVAAKRSGVCGEMAYLYVALARVAGLKSNWVSVTTDYKGDRVNHACAEVEIGGRSVLVDPAYRTFDIEHKEYQKVSDAEAQKMFEYWRR